MRGELTSLLTRSVIVFAPAGPHSVHRFTKCTDPGSVSKRFSVRNYLFPRTYLQLKSLSDRPQLNFTFYASAIDHLASPLFARLRKTCRNWETPRWKETGQRVLYNRVKIVRGRGSRKIFPNRRNNYFGARNGLPMPADFKLLCMNNIFAC